MLACSLFSCYIFNLYYRAYGILTLVAWLAAGRGWHQFLDLAAAALGRLNPDMF